MMYEVHQKNDMSANPQQSVRHWNRPIKEKVIPNRDDLNIFIPDF
ncbi:hypothetical protein SAMN05428949_1667 [Chitinophaga sp. YR627]|nr:hypothetical protein SAMN05428949_1667 [Chitinophaga sp. YR627]